MLAQPSSCPACVLEPGLGHLLAGSSAHPRVGWPQRGRETPVQFYKVCLYQTFQPCIDTASCPLGLLPALRWLGGRHTGLAPQLGASSGRSCIPNSLLDLGMTLGLLGCSLGSTPYWSSFLSCHLCGLFAHRVLGSFSVTQEPPAFLAQQVRLRPGSGVSFLLRVLGALWRMGFGASPGLSTSWASSMLGKGSSTELNPGLSFDFAFKIYFVTLSG